MCVARNIKMHLYEYFILWEKRMNEERPYLQMWRGVWVPFCKIAIVSFLSVRYKSDGLYCRMAGTPSSPTRRYCVKNNSIFYNYICYIYSPWFFICIKLWYKRFVYFFTDGVSLCQKIYLCVTSYSCLSTSFRWYVRHLATRSTCHMHKLECTTAR